MVIQLSMYGKEVDQTYEEDEDDEISPKPSKFVSNERLLDCELQLALISV